MQNERVRHILTPEVLSIDIRESITEAVRLFASYPVHHLPVVDGTNLKGILSTADMLKLEYFRPRSGAQTSAALLNDRFKIEKLMRSPVITAGLDDTIADAASRMVTNAVHSLPVVDEGNHLLGIVTTTDIMQALLHGIGIRRAAEQHEGNPRPTELVMRRAIEAANSALLHGTDPEGIAAAMLYLNERNVLLEALRLDVARYVHGGQDERLHSNLVKDLDKLAQPGQVIGLSVPL
jgi:CBS domain-containing membrane protein